MQYYIPATLCISAQLQCSPIKVVYRKSIAMIIQIMIKFNFNSLKREP